MSARARRLGWRRLLPLLCVLAIGSQFGSLGQAQILFPPGRYADLTLDKTDRVDPVVEGDTITYDLRFRNRGPHTATGVRVVDRLPAGVEFQSATPSDNGNCSADGSTVTCDDFSSFISGESGIVVIRVTAPTEGNPNNSAEIFTDSIDYDSGNNGGSETTQVLPPPPPPPPDAADLSIQKSATSATVTEGDQFSYNISVGNNGPNTANNVVATDTLPDGVEFMSSGGACAAVDANADPVVVNCMASSLASGGQMTGSITVKAGEVSETTSVSNTASVSLTPDIDTNTDNDTSTATVGVEPYIPVANLSIVKTGPATAVKAGQSITYGIDVSNSGVDPATDVTVTDTLHADVDFDSASEGCSYDSENRSVTCTKDEVGVGGANKWSISITVDTNKGGTVANQASVSSQTDANSPKSSTVVETTVDPVADLSISKSGPSGTVETGDSVTYTLGATNAGPDKAVGVVVSDTLPAELSFDAAGSSTSCTAAGQAITCTLGDLEVGSSSPLTIKTVADQTGDDIVNSAGVASSTQDDGPSDNSDSSDPIDIVPPEDANVRISMTGPTGELTVGDDFEYSITLTNDGANAAENVTVVDKLPSGVSPATTLPAGCSSTPGEITCNRADLAATGTGSTQTFAIPVRATAAGENQQNTATVSWNAGDEATESATASHTATIVAPPPTVQQPNNEEPPPEESPSAAPTPTQVESLDGCPTSSRQAAGFPSDGLLAFVPAAIQLEQQRRRRLSLVEDKPSAQKGGKRSRSKVIKIVAVIAVLAVAAVVGVLLLTGGDKGKNYATLGGLEGRVDLQKPEKAFEPATKAATLDIGDKVRTGEDGLARIDYTDGSLTRLDHNTTFQVQELINDDTHKSIKTNLEVGRIWNRVEKLTKQEDRFEVKTVTAVATVHGTTFVTDCRFNGGKECSHIGIEGLFGVKTLLGDQGDVRAGQCKTEEGEDIGPCKFTNEELRNDSFLNTAARLDGLLGDAIVLPEIFGEDKEVALVPVEEETQVQAAQASPATTTTPTEEPACTTGEPASRGTSLPLAGAIALMVIFFGIAWARPNRKSGPAGDSAN